MLEAESLTKGKSETYEKVAWGFFHYSCLEFRVESEKKNVSYSVWNTRYTLKKLLASPNRCIVKLGSD